MRTLVRLFCAVHDLITQCAACLAAAGLATIVLAYVYEVTTRYLFDAPTAWVSDFVSYALCACVFLALPRVTKDKGHVAVTVLVDALPRALAGYIHTFLSIVGFACLAFAGYISLLENIRQFTKGIETLAIVPIPQWWVSSFITIGLALGAPYLLRYAKLSHPTSAPETAR